MTARGRCHIGPKFQTSCVLASCRSLPVGVFSNTDLKLLLDVSDAWEAKQQQQRYSLYLGMALSIHLSCQHYRYFGLGCFRQERTRRR